MGNVNVEEVSFKGASLGTALSVMSYVESNGYSGQHFIRTVSDQLNGQVGHQRGITGGQEVGAEPTGRQNIGGIQNSGFERQ